MQTFNLNKFIEDRANKESKDYKLFIDVLSAYTPEIKDYGWLAGGAIRRLVVGDKMDSDFDFFFKNKEKFDEFYIGIKGDKNIEMVKEAKNENNLQLVVNILGPDGLIHENIIYQLINISYYERVEDLLESFDFTLCQFATDGDSLYCGDTALFDSARRRIVVNKITYPVASLRRILKYSKQDYYCCNGCLTTFLLEASKDQDKIKDMKVKYID